MISSIFLPESIKSTNDAILDYLPENQPPFSLYTFNQLHGKGQYGNLWQMPKDQNLAYSFLIREKEIHTPKELFNFHTAMVVRDFLANLTKEKVWVKWPNDIIINRKKICGMLIEQAKISGESYYIIGIGINVLQEDFSHLPKAGSLYTQTLQRFSLTDFAEKFHQYFSENIINNKENILEIYNKNLFGKDAVSLFMKNKMRQNGIIQSVDREGYLWIQLEKDGLQKFFHKEIEMLY